MAKILENFDFNSHKNNRKYPWNEWFDGQIRQLKKGEDFNCGVVTMYNNISKKAKTLGLKYRIQSTKDSVIFQIIKE